MDSKVCNTCGLSKPLTAFKTSFGGDSRQNKCNACKAFRERIKVKARFLAMYGGKCACCGEDDPRFLTLDHINNDGKEHREEGPTGLMILREAIRVFRPDILQILCFNCNFGKNTNKGICPHKDKSKETYLEWVDKLLEVKRDGSAPFRSTNSPILGLQKLLGLSKEEVVALLKKAE